jgi:hypothetical protein
MKSVLESEGISATIKSETFGRLLGGLLSTGAFGEVQVLVRPDDADRAREILSETRIEPDIPDEEDYRDK